MLIFCILYIMSSVPEVADEEHKDGIELQSAEQLPGFRHFYQGAWNVHYIDD